MFCPATLTVTLFVAGENQSLGPMPLLALLSHEGLLILYWAVNKLQGAKSVCEPPSPLPDTSGLHLFTSPQVRRKSTLQTLLKIKWVSQLLKQYCPFHCYLAVTFTELMAGSWPATISVFKSIKAVIFIMTFKMTDDNPLCSQHPTNK